MLVDMTSSPSQIFQILKKAEIMSPFIFQVRYALTRRAEKILKPIHQNMRNVGLKHNPHTFPLYPTPTPVQKKALELLGVRLKM